jgi:hypothetical protein
MSERPPVVAVIWEDASSPDKSAWVENKDHEYAAEMFTSVGFLLYDGEDGITLTSAWNDNTVAARDHIPRGMVHSVTYLEPVRAKRARK